MGKDDFSLQTILEIARAVEHVQSLDEFNHLIVQAGTEPVRASRALRMLARTCCDPRRIIALMLHAAENPDWAWVNFWAFFCPDMTFHQMSKLRKISKGTIKHFLSQVELPKDAYDFIPRNNECKGEKK